MHGTRGGGHDVGLVFAWRMKRMYGGKRPTVVMEEREELFDSLI